MKPLVSIDRFALKEHGRVFIIAEAGVNHNGELEKALQLVDAASKAGADAVKFQTFRSEDVVLKTAEMATYQQTNLGRKISQLEMIRSFELDAKYWPKIVARCQQRGILFLSTPHGGRRSVDLLESLGVVAYKIGSGDLTNYILLERVAKTRKPIVLSTGMATLEEVRDAVRYIRSKGNKHIILLHATTNYPCPLEEVNLLAMVTMMKELDVPIGFSDHTTNDLSAIAATAFGAAVYECHFTLDKRLPGPDHVASVDPEELKRRIQAIRQTQVLLGNGEKIPTRSERKSMIKIVRKSLVYEHDLQAGYVLKPEDLEAKRPTGGISPIHYEEFLGRPLKIAVKKDQLAYPVHLA